MKPVWSWHADSAMTDCGTCAALQGLEGHDGRASWVCRAISRRPWANCLGTSFAAIRMPLTTSWGTVLAASCIPLTNCFGTCPTACPTALTYSFARAFAFSGGIPVMSPSRSCSVAADAGAMAALLSLDDGPAARLDPRMALLSDCGSLSSPVTSALEAAGEAASEAARLAAWGTKEESCVMPAAIWLARCW